MKIGNGNCGEVEGTQQGSWPTATAQSLQNHRSCMQETNEKGNWLHACGQNQPKEIKDQPPPAYDNSSLEIFMGS